MRATPPAPMVPGVPSSMDVASVAPPSMVPADAPECEVPAQTPGLDPRQVVTPPCVDAVVEKLSALGILADWQGVVDGLREGFDVGASVEIPHSIMFPNHASSSLVRTCSSLCT